MKDLVVVKQIPIIEQNLQSLSEEISAKVSNAMNLVCTEDTVKDVKAVRADLNHQFGDLEDARKQVKKAVLAPYDEFETAYKKYVSDLFKKADADLKGKIYEVESTLKTERQEEVERYFDELKEQNGIDFVSFKNSGVNVTLTASMKSLKEQSKAFIDKIVSDLATIETQEYKDEMIIEYKIYLDVNRSITTVLNRKKALQEQEERRREAEASKPIIVEKPAEKPAEDQPLKAPEEVAVSKMTFTVYGTLPQLKAVKSFLEDGGYDYE